MSDGEQLLLVFSLIYLSGCLVWVNRRMVFFSSWFGGTWRVVVADYLWGNSSGRVYLLNPFPPLGFMFVTYLFPVSLSPTNIVAYNVQTVGNSGRPSQSGQMAPVVLSTSFSRRGSELIVDGKSFCNIGDVTTAHKLVVLLNKIKGCDETAREEAIHSFWAERLDVRNAKKQIRTVLTVSRPMRFLCSAAFFLFFAIIPLVSIRCGVDLAVVFGGAAMLLSALIICAAYFFCHRRHYPAFKEGIWGELMKMMLCPPSALRAGDLIMGKLSAPLDALPVAALLLNGSGREVFLKEYLADLESAKIPENLPDVVRATCLWQNQMILKVGATVIPGLKRFMHAVDDGAEAQLGKNLTGTGNV